MTDITVIILTYNEEKNISECLESVKDIADKIIVCDSFSTDGTIDIAKKYGAEIMQHEFVNQASQFIYAEENSDIKTKWVMRVDADERLTKEACDEITELVRINSDNDVSAVDVYYDVVFLGKVLKHYPFHKVILYKYGKAKMENRNMDEHITIRDGGRCLILKNHLIHNDYNGLTAWINKHNNYSDREAADFYNHNNDETELANLSKSTRIRRFVKYKVYYKLPTGLRSYLYYLFRLYIKGGILDGKEGRIFAFLQAYWYRYLVDAKIYEMQNLPRK